jgi:hypothetical protein
MRYVVGRQRPHKNAPSGAFFISVGHLVGHFFKGSGTVIALFQSGSIDSSMTCYFICKSAPSIIVVTVGAQLRLIGGAPVVIVGLTEQVIVAKSDSRSA